MKLIDFIVCDDIRQENLGKMTFVGVYQDGIEFSENPEGSLFPGLLPKLCFYIRFLFEGQSADEMELRINFNSEEVARNRGPLTYTDPSKLVSLIIQNANFPVTGLGKFEFHLTLYSNKKELAKFSPAYSLSIDMKK